MKRKNKIYMYIFAILMCMITLYVTIYPIYHVGWDKLVSDGRIWLVAVIGLAGFTGTYLYYWVGRYGTGMSEYNDKNKRSLK